MTDAAETLVTTPVTTIARLLAANEAHAAARAGIAVVTWMDSRIDVFVATIDPLR